MVSRSRFFLGRLWLQSLDAFVADIKILPQLIGIRQEIIGNDSVSFFLSFDVTGMVVAVYPLGKSPNQPKGIHTMPYRTGCILYVFMKPETVTTRVV